MGNFQKVRIEGGGEYWSCGQGHDPRNWNWKSFTDIGDANPGNCSSKVVKHLLRLASTGAIARALRSFTNVGLTALEELEDLNDVIGNGGYKTKPKAQKKATPKPKASALAKKGNSGKSDNSDILTASIY